jgi:5-formyltetrahydrofolate cyclo-ligase
MPTLTRDPSFPQDRAALRQFLIERRSRLPANVRQAADRAIGQRLTGLIRAWRSRATDPAQVVVAAWWPIRDEPSLLTVFPEWIAEGFTVALPVVIGPKMPLSFIQWTPQTPMVPGPMQVPQPQAGVTIRPDLMLIPCVGFDQAGWRLGYGAGFYDRTLALDPVASIGVAYDLQELAAIEPHAHDRRLDAMVTETRLIPESWPSP